MRHRFYVCLICILGTCPTWSQTLGLRSPKTKLHQIDTDTVRIIYADGQESRAQRVANLVHYMARKYPIAGNDKHRKISILLQNETDVPNGYVGLAPWVSEFFISPPVGNMGIGSLPWTDLLSIHEFRHVQQRSAARTGLSGFAYYLFGDEFFSGIVNVSWPNWYTEGDAVISETALSNQGRGRLPSFVNAYREKVLSDKEWSYHKVRNGSYKDFVPNHYNLGFLMQNYGRERYGQGFWDNVALESASYKGLLYPFSKAVKRVSGEPTKDFYVSALEYYRELWKAETEEKEVPSEVVINVDHKRYEDHSYPVFDEEGNLYVVIDSYDHIPTIYLYDPLSKKRLYITNPGYTDESVFSVAAGKICWAEYRLDSRWERKDYSTIVIYDERRKQKQRLTKGESYFAPALSRDGKRIVALHDDDFQNYEVYILDVSSGEVLNRLPNPQNYYYSFPSWTPDGKSILSAVRDSIGQMAIALIDIAAQNTKVITPWSFQAIGRPTISGDWIYYTMSEENVDQVFRVHQESGIVKRVVESAHSMYQPIINPLNGDLVYTEYSNDGRRLKKIESEAFSPVDVYRARFEPGYLTIESNEGNILNEIPENQYESRKYSTFAHPVNIHSWRPVFDNPVLGFELRSLNVLQSIRWKTGFQWNTNDNSYGPYSELALGMWYPEILLGYTGWKRSVVGDHRLFNWYENILNAGLRIPFKGLYGPFNYAGSFTSRINRLVTSGDVDYSLNYISYQFNFSNRLRQAQKHPMTRFGQAVKMTLPHSVSAVSAYQFQIQSDFTFPSLRNHVIWIQYDYRYAPSDNSFFFGDNFNYSRGYSAQRSDWIYRVGINYHMPLVYPDIGFAGLIYLKRIRTNIFADLSRLSMEQGQTSMNSAGIELLFDIQLLNVEPFSFGIRWSREIMDDFSDPSFYWRSRFEFFVPVIRI
jgi:Tol biopolymer transport system component